ncbi:MAG: kelch repeat-containing protein [Planctomycetota bacterium]
MRSASLRRFLLAGSLLTLALPAQPRWKPIQPFSPSPGAIARHAAADDPTANQLVVLHGQNTEYPGVVPGESEWRGSARGWAGGSLYRLYPTDRAGHAMATHAGAGHAVLFGGESNDGMATMLDDTWVRARRWQQLSPAKAPPGRVDHTMVPDASGHVLLFGGRDVGGPRADTWRWNGLDWDALLPSTAPAARSEHAVAFDSQRGVVVLFGGLGTGGTLLGDTWEWDGLTWTAKSVAGAPSPRAGHALVFDPASGRVLLFGGATAAGTVADTWAWDGAQWRALATPTAPPATVEHVMMLDPVTGEVQVHGGFNGNVRYGDVWALRGGRWEIAHFTGPSRRDSSAVAYDTARQVMLAYGGLAEGAYGYVSFDDLWQWNGTFWSELLFDRSLAPRMLAVAAYDAARSRFVLTPDYLGTETAEWDGTTWVTQPTPELKQGELAYHSARGRVMNVGPDGLQEWDGSAWASVPSAGPAPTVVGNVAYDTARDRIVVYEEPDLYEWDGSTWAVRPAPGLGFAGYLTFPELVYDEGRQRLVASVPFPCGAQEGWEWDGQAWIKTESLGPGPNKGFRQCYAPDLQAVLQFSGVDECGPASRYYGTVYRYGEVSGGEYASFGAACPGFSPEPILGSETLPCAGSIWRATITQLPPATPGFLLVGASNTSVAGAPLPLDMTRFGAAPGCQLLVSPDVAIPFRTFGGTQVWLSLRLANPSLIGAAFYTQGLVAAPGFGTLQIMFTAGKRAVIGGV